jgi:hypothetical protein
MCVTRRPSLQAIGTFLGMWLGYGSLRHMA